MDKETKRVMEKTGLTKEEADIYQCFYMHADWSGESVIVMPGDVTFNLGRLLDEQFGGLIIGRTRQRMIQGTYDHWLNVFRCKGLIAKDDIKFHPFSDPRLNENYSFPKLVGYNPLNDPELYAAYRKKGEKRWSGRMSRELLETEGRRMQGYEFRT